MKWVYQVHVACGQSIWTIFHATKSSKGQRKERVKSIDCSDLPVRSEGEDEEINASKAKAFWRRLTSAETTCCVSDREREGDFESSYRARRWTVRMAQVADRAIVPTKQRALTGSDSSASYIGLRSLFTA